MHLFGPLKSLNVNGRMLTFIHPLHSTTPLSHVAFLWARMWSTHCNRGNTNQSTAFRLFTSWIRNYADKVHKSAFPCKYDLLCEQIPQSMELKEQPKQECISILKWFRYRWTLSLSNSTFKVQFIHDVDKMDVEFMFMREPLNEVASLRKYSGKSKLDIAERP